jgi:alpha-ketoglutarate-dependent taurine dioxygenase
LTAEWLDFVWGHKMALRVRELTPWFGAEVSGLVPAETLDEATCRELQQLMNDRELLVFRDLDIDRYFQNYLCELLRVEGQPDPEVVAYNAQRQGTFYISNKRDGAAAPFGELMFHSDATYSAGPYEILSLWAEEVVPPVAPTRFVSVTRAWDTLPDDLRARVEGRFAEQTNQVQDRASKGERLLTAIREESTIVTPVGHVNPRSGRTMLYVCSMVTKRILDMEPGESERLLGELFAHTESPGSVWEHEWGNNDLVVWDNLSVQHARPDVEADGPVRTLRKAASPAVPAGLVAQQSYGTMNA